MVKTRRSNGENGEVDEGNETLADVGSVSDEKASNWSQRELRSSQTSQYRKIPRWPTKYRQRRLRAIKMSRIVFPESDTEPEKYTKRSRKVRVFFAAEKQPNPRGIRRRDARKNSLEDSEDKPIQQNVRRSCRKRKLLHHNFNESWITNELKVKGYPDLYGYPGFSSSDEFSSGEEARESTKKITHSRARELDESQLSRTRRTSARFTNKKVVINDESDFEEDNNQTVIEKKPAEGKTEDEKEDQKMEVEERQGEKTEVKTENELPSVQDSESNQGPSTRTTRTRGRRRQKKEDSQESDSSSSESGSELTLTRQPRRSNRTRQSKPAFVQIAPREPRPRTNSFTHRKKPYSLRERKPLIRRATLRSVSPSSSTSTTSDDSARREDLNVSMKNKSKGRQKSKTTTDDKKKEDRALRDIQPLELDGSVRFSSVGGLEEHIKCLREMVLFPLMYPDLFAQFNTRPAKGVLFHGPPGTGKTLLARALANECSLVGGRKVAFFMRKGADCLKKWVGESERNIKLLFQQANKMKPSIIFFDEIDALAPVRSVRQDQVHTSVVGTLLAEMDGLCDRGEVVIIGATNRLDAVDPALRRAGRFDRELHFPPPPPPARARILRIYTRDWHPPLDQRAIEDIADATTGYGGSDLKALCSEAVLKALRRVYPQVYDSDHALLINAKNVEVTKADMLEAMGSLVACGARASPPAARPLPAHCAPLLQAQLQAASQLLQQVAPTTDRSSELTSSTLLISGECADTLLAPALLAQMEHCTVKELNLATLHSVHAFTQEQAIISLFSECRRAEGAGEGSAGSGAGGCVLFVRDVAAVWGALCGSPGAALLLQLWRARAAGRRTLLLATAPAHRDTLPEPLQELFPVYRECVYHVREPTSAEVLAFLKPVLTEAPLQPPPHTHHHPPPPLPRAPPPPPPRESSVDRARRKRTEDYKLRELRIFLRDICRKLASNRRFYKFTKPVDLEEVTDYLDIIKQPMDLETMMTKVDMHKYNCAKEFLDDIDLICANALEYNPDRTSSDKQIRHEACSLRDHAHALIDVEMDSDFELECREIARTRRLDGNADHDLPDFIYTASNSQHTIVENSVENKSARTPHNCEKSDAQGSKRKRRRMHSAWAKGLVAKRHKAVPKNCKESSMVITDEESKENKPITSTPLPNGDALRSSSSGSDDDAPLKRPQDDTLFNLSSQTVVNNHMLDSPAKSTERLPAKTSPKKRNSGHDVPSSDQEKVLINKTELDNILYKNAKALRGIGLPALLDLHAQLSRAVHAHAPARDRTRLPAALATIVGRYVQLNNHK